MALNFLIIDNINTLRDPNASRLDIALALIGITPLGKVESVAGKMFVNIMKEGKVISAAVSSEIKWINYAKHDFKSIKGYKKMSWSDIRDTTKHGNAMYKTDIDIEALERYAWEYGTPTTNGKTWKVMKFDEVIGATKGKDTVYMRIELSADSMEIHGHPITEQEYKNLLKD
ncbi:hypothetical protein [Paenibacillus sp. BAC0078]